MAATFIYDRGYGLEVFASVWMRGLAKGETAKTEANQPLTVLSVSVGFRLSEQGFRPS